MNDDLMMPKEVAELFRVNPRTVVRWSKEGKIQTIRTPGGHRRYLRASVEACYKVEGVQSENGRSPGVGS